MEYSAKNIEELTGISIDRQRIRLKSLFPDQPFNRHEILNGRTVPVLNSFLHSNRTIKKEKTAIRKLLKQGNNLAVTVEYNKPSTEPLNRQPESKKQSWTRVLSILPLPMLGLAASYGVYFFASQFVPILVAIGEAAAFELTYIGLASMHGLNENQQVTAKKVAIGAVVVSVIYNTLAGAIHQNPQIIEGLSGFWFWSLSVIHGAPLAILAYFVADLIFHTENK